ncbi:ABC transporter permease [Vineibacter terrae]|uniref:ABC transporter permease n=1 Tax=Vineibacter terrae TaxID=2586908 RepID=A0A5C8PV22_9HYPH|nr:ABC transporter permease [Vineibacter terrae]TXL81759.1 ABC transporter permease [Vineibacter terrae]
MLHRSVWPYIASIAALLLLWQLAAGWVDSRALPTPMAVLAVLEREVTSGALPYHLAVTLARVAASFFLALLIGSAIGIVMGRSVLIDRLGDSWLIVFLNLPALVTIVLCYVWFGLTEAAAILAVTINKIPNVVVTVREGARAISRDLLEMAQVFQLGRVRTLRHVVLPSLGPFIIAAARSGLAIVWKIVLVVELLGRSSGVGFQINLFFQLFDVAGILAYTIAFVAVIQLLELGVLQPLERRANRWRR